MRKTALIIGLTCGCLFLVAAMFQALAAPEMPTGDHCGDVGPLPIDDPDFCGCTWGEVLFHGQPAPGAAVTLTYGSGFVTGTTRFTLLEDEPYFDLTAHYLEAQRGDLLTQGLRLEA
jgi:hypothetical protein